jgi:putative alpha-1,2-mannosidase
MINTQQLPTPVAWVNPLIDTANRRFFFFSSACRPFGMVNLSPDTMQNGAWGSGYRYYEPHILWFSHVHARAISVQRRTAPAFRMTMKRCSPAIMP